MQMERVREKIRMRDEIIKEFEKISKSDYMQRFYSIQAIAMFYSNFIPLLFSGTTIFFASGITIFLID